MREKKVERVLAVGAHPDDVEILCGVKYAEAFSRYEVWPRMSCERLLP